MSRQFEELGSPISGQSRHQRPPNQPKEAARNLRCLKDNILLLLFIPPVAAGPFILSYPIILSEFKLITFLDSLKLIQS